MSTRTDNPTERKGPRRPLPQDVARAILEEATDMWNAEFDMLQLRVRGRQIRFERHDLDGARSVGEKRREQKSGPES